MHTHEVSKRESAFGCTDEQWAPLFTVRDMLARTDIVTVKPAVRRNHAGAGIALRRAELNPLLQLSREIQEACAFCGQSACGISCDKDVRQDVMEVPRNLFRLEPCVE